MGSQFFSILPEKKKTVMRKVIIHDYLMVCFGCFMVGACGLVIFNWDTGHGVLE
jgi:hypothetical protein